MSARIPQLRGNIVRVIFAALLATTAFAASASADPISSAAERFFTIRPGGVAAPSPREFGGGACDGAGGEARVWWGRFAGGKARVSGSGRTSFTVRSTEGCFASRRGCEAWMAALKTRFGDKPIHNQCRQGYEPGAPLPPWWSQNT